MTDLFKFLEGAGIYCQSEFELGVNGLVYEYQPGIKLKSCFIDAVDMGAYSYIERNSIINQASIGRFCSIASDVKIGLGRHPLDWMSTHCLPHSSINGMKPIFNFDNSPKSTFISHDVWIGTGAIIIGGISIGLGAVIGAGSVVTKDVPPFAIVGGNPAKIIKYRFDEHLRTELLNSKWWDIRFASLLASGITPPLDNPIAMLEWLKNAPENLPRISSEKRRLIRNGTEWKVVDV